MERTGRVRPSRVLRIGLRPDLAPTMSRISVFVCFDGDHDADLEDRLREQATGPGSTFDIASVSQGRTLSSTWASSARSRIRAADEVVVICGEHSARSARMAAEMQIVLEEEKPYLLLWGRRDCMCKMPAGARRDDVMYGWTRDTFDVQLQATLQSAQPIVVPEDCKRQQP